MASLEPAGESLRDLFARLIDNGKAYAQAEVTYYKRTALGWVDQAKFGVAFAVVALFILQAALTTLLVALGFFLATWLGPAGGLAVAAVIGIVVAGLLAWAAASRFGGSR